MLPAEIYYEIFQYLRPSERIILNEIDPIKIPYQNFVRSTIWSKIFKDLRPNGIRSCIRPESVNEIKFETYGETTIIKELNINEFFIKEYKTSETIKEYKTSETIKEYKTSETIKEYKTSETIKEYNQSTITEVEITHDNPISHFMILGKNITKVEFMIGNCIIHHQYFLKQDLVRIVPFDTCFITLRNAKNCMKIYADSVSKVYSKVFYLRGDTFETLNRSCIVFDTFLYSKNSIHMLLFYVEGLSCFRYEVNGDILHSIYNIYSANNHLKYAKKYPMSDFLSNNEFRHLRLQ